jgi:demethylmenaquinone methyltransferase/2-methoxy-6-polyprenyl-1,4-benzoquinol methylase
MSGARPQGLDDEKSAARWVRQMFEHVAPRYDLLNHLLSLNCDRRWRRLTVSRLRPLLRQPHTRVLDLCCGTADLALALERQAPGRVWACDFSLQMLSRARLKGFHRIFAADALALPLPDAVFDIVTVAFGLRNLASWEAGLREIRRVLKPGGALAVLEFSTPPQPLFRTLYDAYSRHIIPRIGGLLSGSPSAYRYLHDSVRRFPNAPQLAHLIRSCGFASVEFDYQTFGIVALHLARA